MSYLNMVVDSPKVFDSAERSDKTEIVFPLVAFFVFEKPERPAEVKCDARIPCYGCYVFWSGCLTSSPAAVADFSALRSTLLICVSSMILSNWLISMILT